MLHILDVPSADGTCARFRTSGPLLLQAIGWPPQIAPILHSELVVVHSIECPPLVNDFCEGPPSVPRWELLTYARGQIVTRRAEGVHGNIKKHQKAKDWMVPSLLNTKLKLPQLVAQLDDPDFWHFCVQHYNRRNLSRLVVSFATPVRDRWKLDCEPQRKTLERIYLYNVDAQFRDLSGPRAALKSWKKIRTDTEGPSRVDLTLADQCITDWIKSHFACPHVHWSMPRAIMDRISASSSESAQVRKPEGAVELPSLPLRVDKCLELICAVPMLMKMVGTSMISLSP
jgi:hypothetical protein